MLISGDLLLYRTGEEHTNGMPVYRKKGDRKAHNSKGKTGVYYIFDGTTMYVCGEPYKDEYGCYDGEPLWPISGYTIVE
jgi:hypothetical protein